MNPAFAQLRWAALVLLLSAASWADAPIPGQYIVMLRQGASIDEVLAVHRPNVMHRYGAALLGFAASLPDSAVAELKADPRVEHIEQDQLVELIATQTNPPWGLDRVDQRESRLDRAYTYNFTGAGVNVYVIDSGIRLDHVDFGGRASVGFDAFREGGIDCLGHGTHVAGTVGGTTYGVAKGARLVAVRVFQCSRFTATSTVIAGVDWVTRNHVSPAVANMSLGGGISTAMDSAVATMIRSGVATAVAAGNSNIDACNSSPARVPDAMTIGATSSTDARASFSNWGPCVDWFAPGVGIPSAWYTSSTATQTLSGTSMASPHTAGAAALYLEQAPTASPQLVRDALYSFTTKGIVSSSLSPNNHLLYTLFSAGGGGDLTPPTVAVTSPADGSTVLRGSQLDIQATATDNVGVAQVEFFVNGDLECTDTSAPYTCTWQVPRPPGKTYRIEAKAADFGGNVASSSVGVTSIR